MNTYLKHHGIKNQRWGVRNGPPYPLERSHYNNANDVNMIHKSFSRKDIDYMTGIGNDLDILNAKAYKNKKSIPYAKSIINKKQPVSYVELSNIGNKKLNLSIGTINMSEFRGKGYASKLVKDAINYFEEQKTYDTINWWADKENIRSVELAINNGFTYSKTDIINGQEWVLYVLNKEH